jgi:hypothetical protein
MQKYSSQITVISQINTEWELLNIKLIVNALRKQKISCNLLLIILNPIIHRSLSNYNLEKYSFIKINKPTKNYSLHIMNIVRNIKKKYPDSPYFVITSKNYGIEAITLRDVSFLISGCFISLQHGEGFDAGYTFGWKFGWVGSRSLQYPVQFFYRVLIAFLLNLRSFFTVFFLNKANNYSLIYNFLRKNNLFSYDIRDSCDLIFLIAKHNYNYLCKLKPSLQKKISISGSLLAEQYRSKINKNSKNVNNNKKLQTILFYTTGAFKNPNSKLALKQLKIVETLLIKCGEKNLKLSVKCKLAEIPYFASFNKLNSDNKNYLLYDSKNIVNYLPIIPIDSTVCLKYLLLGKGYFTYNLFNSLGYIGECNKFYKRPDMQLIDYEKLNNPNFNDNIKQVEKISGGIVLKPSNFISKKIIDYLRNS